MVDLSKQMSNVGSSHARLDGSMSQLLAFNDRLLVAMTVPSGTSKTFLENFLSVEEARTTR